MRVRRLLRRDVVNTVDDAALSRLVVVPVDAVFEVGTALAAGDLLVEDGDREDSAHGARGCGGEVLLINGDGRVAGFGVGGPGCCLVRGGAGDALIEDR